MTVGRRTPHPSGPRPPRRDVRGPALGLHADAGTSSAQRRRTRRRGNNASTRLYLWTCLQQPIALRSQLLFVLRHFMHEGSFLFCYAPPPAILLCEKLVDGPREPSDRKSGANLRRSTFYSPKPDAPPTDPYDLFTTQRILNER